MKKVSEVLQLRQNELPVTISKMIQELEELKEKYGDCEVYVKDSGELFAIGKVDVRNILNEEFVEYYIEL